MSKLQFDGKVDTGANWGGVTGVTVGGRDVIREIDQRWPRRDRWPREIHVVLGVAAVAGRDSVITLAADGEMTAEYGFSGSDATPAEAPRITVGRLDVLLHLRDLDGREVVLILEDDDQR